MELRGTYEKQEKGVRLDFQLVNTSNRLEDINFSSSQQFEVYIVDEMGEEVYRYSQERFFTMAMTTKQLAAGETLKWQDTWNYIDMKGTKRKEGKYKATITIKAFVEEKFEDALITVVDIVL